MATALPRIAVIGTGGTLSSLGTSSLDVLTTHTRGRAWPGHPPAYASLS
jgi:L-asparaginase/Glu-tRNA(Gln) amidotransferase subunit D